MIAPELYCPNLEETGYSYEIDVYSIGILLYEIIVGQHLCLKLVILSKFSSLCKFDLGQLLLGMMMQQQKEK